MNAGGDSSWIVSHFAHSDGAASICNDYIIQGAAAAAAVILSYLVYVKSARMKSYYRLDAIEDVTLEEAHEIYTTGTIFTDFPFLSVKSLEFGLFRTYGIPSISKLLVSTGQLVQEVPRRYDDTNLIMREIMENPPHDPKSKLALQRLNYLHGRYNISNADFLYVLAIFCVEPIRWLSRFGYRNIHPVEKKCAAIVWQDVGIKMGITGIPATYTGFEKYIDDYETRHMKYCASNAQLANSGVDFFLSVVPSVLHPLGRRVVHAMCEPRLRAAMGFPSPPMGLTTIVHSALHLCALFTRHCLLPRTHPVKRCGPAAAAATTTAATAYVDETETALLSSMRRRAEMRCPMFHPYEKTYEHGYYIDELGPAALVQDRQLSALCERTSHSIIEY